MMEELVYTPKKYKDRIRGLASGYHICPTCGSKFHIPDISVYAYREDSFTFCRWNCLCAYRKWANGQTFETIPLGNNLPLDHTPDINTLEIVHAIDDAIEELGFTTAWELICRLRKNGSIRQSEDYEELCKKYLRPNGKTAKEWLDNHIHLPEKEIYIIAFAKNEAHRIAMAENTKKAIQRHRESKNG